MSSRTTLSTPPDRVRARLDASREEVAASLLAIGERLRWAGGWRHAVRRRPVVMLGVAFGLGFVVAKLTSRKGSEE